MTAKTMPDSEAERDNSWPMALRLLAYRDYSQAELKKRLCEKGFSVNGVEETLERCLKTGYLDDNRYATNRAIQLMTQGRAFGRGVLEDLKRRGISDELASQALATARTNCDEEGLLEKLLHSKYPHFNFRTASARDKRRVVQFFQRRGCTTQRIIQLLTEREDDER